MPISIDYLVNKLNSDFLSDLKIEEGGCRLCINETHIIEIEPTQEHERYVIYSSLGEIPANKRNEIQEYLLELNLFGVKTGRSVFAFDEKTEQIIFFKSVDFAHCEYEDFLNILQEYIGQLEHWIQKVENLIR